MSNVSYKGNPLIFGAGTRKEFTLDQAMEYAKCENDPVYFIEKYVKIITIDHGLQPMILYPFQKQIVQEITKSNSLISACARQLGKTTVMAALFCHYIIFNEGKTCAILANKASTSREILSRVKRAYEHLPNWIKHGVCEWNKGTILLDNDSGVMAASTSSSAIRGFSINFLFLDEFAFVPNNIAEEFFTSVYPTISGGQTSKLVMISTPNGMNHFYKFWMEAIDGTNGFAHVKAVWSDIPSRTKKWAENQRKILGDVKFSQEMEVEFIGASNTLISGIKLKSIPTIRPVYKSETMSVFERPQINKSYVMTVDVARGVGLDYSAFVVVDVTQIPYRVVAKYRDNKISTTLFPGLVFKVAVEYNNASVLIETNDMGESVANALFFDYEYELTLMAKGDKISSWGGQGTRPGVKTTKKSKRIGCDALKQIVEGDKIDINDVDILYELSNFVAKGDSYAADNGNDDLVMCLVLLGYLTTQPSMQDISAISLKEKIIEERMRMAEEEMIPVGFITDGSEIHDDIKFNF
jgi:hypothetical protein